MKKRLFSFTQFVTAILVLLAFNPDHTSAVQSNLFKIYNRLQIDILHKKYTLREAGHFRNVLVNDSEFQSAKNLLSKISRVNDRDERNSLYDKLYKLFVTAQPNPDVLYACLIGSKKIRRIQAGQTDKSRRQYSWAWCPLGNAMIMAYDRTKQERFLDLFIKTYDGLLDQRDVEKGTIDQVRDRVLNSWSSRLKVERNWEIAKRFGVGHEIRTNEVTVAALMVYPSCRFIEMAFNCRELEPEYKLKAQQYLNIAEAVMKEFDGDFHELSGRPMGYYVMPHDGNAEPLNHSHIAGAVFAHLYDITGKKEYRLKVELLCNTFRSSLRMEANGSYSWGYRPKLQNTVSGPAEAFWKGAITLMLPLAAYKKNLGFSEEDMHAFSNTFLKNVYLEDDRFNVYISRTKSLLVEKSEFEKKRLNKVWNRTTSICGWIFLDRFNPSIRKVIENAVANRTDIFPKGWFSHSNSIQAYAYRLKRNNGVERPQLSALIISREKPKITQNKSSIY